MFLRRMIENVRRQDWTAIAVELVVVVLGVFIGLQAANWNEDRLSAQRGAELTTRLRADLRVESWNFAMQIGYYGQVRASALRAADALAGITPLDDEALLVAAYRATQYYENTRQRTTYDELISTGEMGLVTDPELRNLAMELYSTPVFELMPQEGRSSQFRVFFRKRIAHDVQAALGSACGDRTIRTGDFTGVDSVLDYPCRLGLPADAVATAAATLRGDPETLPLLRLRIADTGTNISQFDAYLPTLRDAMRKIAAESR
ncbi:MAG: hypothetical protein J0L88_08230 [Xanthomonadales bacterium]|nr:hypothetical protein [Xanthomonadales bacterium]